MPVSSLLRGVRRGFAIVLVTIAFVAGHGWAQIPGDSPGEAEPSGIGEPVILLLILAGGFVLLLGLISKVLDLRLRRDGEVVAVKGVISEALGGDPELFELPLTTKVRVPLLRGRPVTIRVFGEVPSDEIKEVALCRVKRAAAEDLSVRARVKGRGVSVGASKRRRAARSS